MIDEIRITGLNEWPLEAIEQLKAQVSAGSDVPVWSNGHEVGLELPEEWANLKRESLKNDVQKTLSKAEHDHGLEATVLSIEKTEKEDRQEVGFE